MTEVVQKIRKADRTRRALLDAALSVIGSKGYAAATVDEIVRKAGVSKGVAYYHFRSKEDIASSILDQEFKAFENEFKSIASQEGTPEEILLRMLEVFAARLYDNKEIAQFFSAEMWRDGRAWSEGVRKSAQGLVDLIAHQLCRGQETGAVRLDLEPTFAAASIVGMVVVDALYFLGEDRAKSISSEEFITHIFDFAHNAVTAK